MISHDIFIVLDVRWLAGVLKPILDHRGIIQNYEGRKVRGARLFFLTHFGHPREIWDALLCKAVSPPYLRDIWLCPVGVNPQKRKA